MPNHPNRRISDNDLKIRHSALYGWLCALGLVDDDGSKRAVYQMMNRVNRAVEAGHMFIDSRGHYRLSREYHRMLGRRNHEQPR